MLRLVHIFCFFYFTVTSTVYAATSADEECMQVAKSFKEDGKIFLN